MNDGAVAPELAAELPALRLLWERVEGGPQRSPREVRKRLKDHSDRFRGPQAIAMRREPIPHAYRAFFRQVGVDPDTERTPVEAAVVNRLIMGGWRSRDLINDACALALLETGVPLWALDGNALAGAPRLRLAAGGEPLGDAPYAPWLPGGRIVVADDDGPVAVLFGEPAEGRAVTRATTAVVLFAVQVAGVPDIHVEEAFDTAIEVVRAG